MGAFEFLFLLAILGSTNPRPDAIVWRGRHWRPLQPVRCVRASVSVLTSIELEHTELLGPTEELIAYDKVDALAPGGCVVLSPPSRRRWRCASLMPVWPGKATLPALTSRRVTNVANSHKAACHGSSPHRRKRIRLFA